MTYPIVPNLPSRYRVLDDNRMAGGFGSVIRVQDTYLGRVVLFKSMHDVANNAQLLNEVRGLSKARSRHVVEIYDVVTDRTGSLVGIIIEMLTGRDFMDFHTEFLRDRGRYIQTLYQIAAGLSDLHSAGIVHRDLKLDNIKESDAGLLKLFDFGISSSNPDYRTVNNRGTFTYAAPELYVPNANITKEMDVYAFGVCAWCLATNVIPAALEERPPQRTTRAPSIDEISPGSLPTEIAVLIDACLHTDFRQRPSAASLAVLFGRYLVSGNHRGIFVQGNNSIYELSASKPIVNIKIGVLGELTVRYDGVVFYISFVSGDVFINNASAVVGLQLHQACVITFGAAELGAARQFVTFSSSHPEVFL